MEGVHGGWGLLKMLKAGQKAQAKNKAKKDRKLKGWGKTVKREGGGRVSERWYQREGEAKG